MNKTEDIALRWLKAQGYKNIVFQHRHSPDFLTDSGEGFEVKKLKHNAIVFSETQLENLSYHPRVTVLVFNKGEMPIEIIPFSEISSPPCYWKSIRVVRVDFHKYRPAITEPRMTLAYNRIGRWKFKPPMTGEEIKSLRQSLGLKPLEFGIKLKVGIATVYRWERGEGRPLRLHRRRLERLRKKGKP